jgi:hypothetical protein
MTDWDKIDNVAFDNRNVVSPAKNLDLTHVFLLEHFFPEVTKESVPFFNRKYDALVANHFIDIPRIDASFVFDVATLVWIASWETSKNIYFQTENHITYRLSAFAQDDLKETAVFVRINVGKWVLNNRFPEEAVPFLTQTDILPLASLPLMNPLFCQEPPPPVRTPECSSSLFYSNRCTSTTCRSVCDILFHTEMSDLFCELPDPQTNPDMIMYRNCIHSLLRRCGILYDNEQSQVVVRRSVFETLDNTPENLLRSLSRNMHHDFASFVNKVFSLLQQQTSRRTFQTQPLHPKAKEIRDSLRSICPEIATLPLHSLAVNDALRFKLGILLFKYKVFDFHYIQHVAFSGIHNQDLLQRTIHLPDVTGFVKPAALTFSKGKHYACVLFQTDGSVEGYDPSDTLRDLISLHLSFHLIRPAFKAVPENIAETAPLEFIPFLMYLRWVLDRDITCLPAKDVIQKELDIAVSSIKRIHTFTSSDVPKRKTEKKTSQTKHVPK